jgi:hypothetical protein
MRGRFAALGLGSVCSILCGSSSHAVPFYRYLAGCCSRPQIAERDSRSWARTRFGSLRELLKHLGPTYYGHRSSPL